MSAHVRPEGVTGFDLMPLSSLGVGWGMTMLVPALHPYELRDILAPIHIAAY